MTRDMTSGAPLRRILAFCLPMVAGNLLQQFYNLADSIIVGRVLGVNAFAAVGSTGALNFLVLGFALGICSGFSIPIAQRFGAGDVPGVRRAAGQLIWLGLGFSLLMTALTFFTTRGVLRMVNTPEEIFEDAYAYIFIVFMGAGATILYNLGSGVLRALGDSRTPLVFLLAAVAINVALDVLFMTKLGMGVEGAAYATVISQAASGLACLAYIHRCVPILRLRASDVRPDWKLMLKIMGVGVPMGLQFSITAVGSIILQSAVNALGAASVAAVSAASKVHNIVAAPLETVGVTMATYSGQNLGAGRVERVREGVRAIMSVSVAYCAVALGINYFAGTLIARLFLDASQTEILAQAHRYLWINGLAYPMLAVILVYRNSLQGLGFSNSAMLAGLAELVARAIVGYGLAARFGYAAVCLANPLAWLFADAMLLPLYGLKMRALERRAPSPAPQRAEVKICA